MLSLTLSCVVSKPPIVYTVRNENHGGDYRSSSYAHRRVIKAFEGEILKRLSINSKLCWRDVALKRDEDRIHYYES